MLQKVAGNLIVLVLILFPLQEVAVPTHPGKGFPSAVGTAGDHIARDGGSVSHGAYHFPHRLYRVPGIVRAAGRALEKSVVSLDLGHFIFRIEFDKLGILIGG